MKTAFLLAVACMFTSGAYSQLTETFSYPNGNLTTVSGGKWEKWDAASSGDATVTNGVARLEDTTDVVTFFTNVLGVASTQPTASFDLFVSTSNSTENYQLFLGSSSSPASDPTHGTNYGTATTSEGLLLDLDQTVVDGSGNPVAPAAGMTWLGLSDALGNNAILQVPVGQTLTFRFVMNYDATAKQTNYVIYINGGLIVNTADNSAFVSTFNSTDPRGLNSFEFYTAPDATNGAVDPNAFATIDNINVNATLIGDTDGNGCVDDFDLTNVILDFGGAPMHGNSDFTGANGLPDGVVDDFDLTAVIVNFLNGC